VVAAMIAVHHPTIPRPCRSAPDLTRHARLRWRGIDACRGIDANDGLRIEHGEEALEVAGARGSRAALPRPVTVPRWKSPVSPKLVEVFARWARSAGHAAVSSQGRKSSPDEFHRLSRAAGPGLQLRMPSLAPSHAHLYFRRVCKDALHAVDRRSRGPFAALVSVEPATSVRGCGLNLEGA
jgi:hypothetical protein